MAEGAELQQPPVRLHPLPRGLLADWLSIEETNIHQIQMKRHGDPDRGEKGHERQRQSRAQGH